MQSRLKGAKSLKEKLDIVSDTAKKYFQGVYGVSPNVSYSKLIKGFEKANRKSEADFCKKMFAAHYSEKDLSEDDIASLAALLFDIETAKMKEDKVMSDSYVEPKVVSEERKVAEGGLKVVDDLVVAEKGKVASDRIRAIEDAKRVEIEGARKAIMEKVDMMKSGFEKNVEETLPRENVMEGIAQKIIRKEKERLRGEIL
jgi:disulfide oxidoreductase YuzD